MEHSSCELVIFNDDTGVCLGYLGYDVLMSGEMSDEDDIRKLAESNFSLIDCAVDPTAFCPREMDSNAFGNAEATTTWPTNVICPVRRVGTPCDPCKIGNSQIPFDLLYNSHVEKPTMYCEDGGVSSYIKHFLTDQDESERLTCFASMPYESWPSCQLPERIGGGPLEPDAKAFWKFGNFAGLNIPQRCPEGTSKYKDLLDQKWEEFNSYNGSIVDMTSFQKDYLELVRGHHGEFLGSH